MKMSFFEFCRNRVPAEVLLKAQLEQLLTLPSPLELVAKRGWLPATVAVEILLVQEKQGLTFVAAAAQLGHWNAELEEKLNAAYAELRTPLNDILQIDPSLEPGLVDALWAEYSGESTAVVSSPMTLAPASESAPTPSPSVTPLAAAGPAPVTGDLFLDEILGQAWRALHATPTDAPAVVHAFHQLQGVLRFHADNAGEARATVGEKLFRAFDPAEATRFVELGSKLARSIAQPELAAAKEEAESFLAARAPATPGESA